MIYHVKTPCKVVAIPKSTISALRMTRWISREVCLRNCQGILNNTQFLLGIEEKEEEAFAVEMDSLLRQIKDKRTKKILLAQINALIGM